MNLPQETPVWQPGQPKLLDRVRDRCRVRHLSLSTEHAYLVLRDGKELTGPMRIEGARKQWTDKAER
jgi:hypothetical protein